MALCEHLYMTINKQSKITFSLKKKKILKNEIWSLYAFVGIAKYDTIHLKTMGNESKYLNI